MCIMSAVTDHYQGLWPNPGGANISWAEYTEYMRLKKMAEELDQKLNQPDCVKPGVEDWEKKVEDVLSKNKLIPWRLRLVSKILMESMTF